MTNEEKVDKLDQLIRDFEQAQKKAEAANLFLNETAGKLGIFLGNNSKNLPEIKDEAHRMIGQLLLAERRNN